MKPLKKFIATVMFIIAGLPLSLGGLSLISTRALVRGADLYTSILSDPRTESLIQSIEVPSSGTASYQLDGYQLETLATIQALREILPPRLIIETLDTNIQSFFIQAANPSNNQVLAVLDISRLRAQVLANSDKALEIYFGNAKEFPSEVLDTLAGSYPQSKIDAIKANPKAYQQELAPLFNAKLEELPSSISIPLPADMPAGSINLASIQKAHSSGVVFVSLTALMLLFASAFIKETDWRLRAISLGKMMMVPGTIILVVGIIPFLINPDGLVKQLPEMPVLFPEMVSYAKFVGQKLMAGFLISGVVTVAAASGLLACRFIPARDDEQD